MRATNLHKVFVLYAVLLSSVACGGEEQPPPAASPASEPSVDTIRAAPKAEAPKAEAPKVEAPKVQALRCGDFITAADAKALGIEAPGYDESTTQDQPGLGVVCMVGPITIGVFRGDELKTMMDGLKAAGVASGVKLQEGPSIGAGSQWTAMGPIHTVMFTGTSKKFTGNVSGTDKALVEKTARAVDAKM